MVNLPSDISVVGLVCHAAAVEHIGVEFAGTLDRARLSSVIDVDEAKTGAFSLKPFKIVAEAPVILPLERQTGAEHGPQMLVNIPGTEGVLIVAGSVFRDPDGTLQKLFQLFCDLWKTVGIDLPAEIIARTVFPNTVGKARDG